MNATSYDTLAARRQAVETRDAGADGVFVYAVRSTHIYCRPACPSRRPNLDAVEYFDTPESAEQAGYRACKRCAPRDALPAALAAERVARACRLLDENPALRVGELAAALDLRPERLHRLFRAVLGITPHRYAAAARLEHFRREIQNGEALASATYGAGFGSSARLYQQAPARLGTTPGGYRKGGTGMQIRYTLADSSLGRLLVASTPRGVCMVSLGDDDAALVAGLQAEYPAAQLTRDEGALNTWTRSVLDYLGGRPGPLDVPLDVRASAFRLRVWEELRRIPYGETRTYADVARAIGRPEAVRAVAGACAGNPVALVTPCHRVLRSDGGLGGYRWGVGRKQALLAREKGERSV